MNHLKFRAFGDKNNTLIVCQQKMDAHSGNFLPLCHIFLHRHNKEQHFNQHKTSLPDSFFTFTCHRQSYIMELYAQ